MRVLALLLGCWLGAAQAAGLLEAERQALLEGGPVRQEGLGVDVPAWVEDGAFVPLTLHLQDARPPLRLVLLREAETDPRIAHLVLHRWRAPLTLTLRVRLPQSQTLEVLARDGDGRRWQVRQAVRVAGSSCLSPPTENPLAGLGETRAWLRPEGGGRELVGLLRHPMESGRRRDAAGTLLPRHLLQRLQVEGESGVLLELDAFEGLSANPYLRLLLSDTDRPAHLLWTDADGTVYRHAL